VKAGVYPETPRQLDVNSTYVEISSCAEIVFAIKVLRVRRNSSNMSTLRETVMVILLSYNTGSVEQCDRRNGKALT
jgi:hypothetical protein